MTALEEHSPVFESVFMFFSRSSDAYPGTGAGEKIHPSNHTKYADLAKIPNWRKMLSNFYARNDRQVALFELDGFHWRSVEHYFQANKFINKAPEYYKSFTLESGSNVGRGDGVIAKKAGRGMRLSPQDIAEWDECKAGVMAKAHHAKFTQNEDCANVLKLTDGALLTHRATRLSPIVHEIDLMALRKKLLSTTQ